MAIDDQHAAWASFGSDLVQIFDDAPALEATGDEELTGATHGEVDGVVFGETCKSMVDLLREGVDTADVTLVELHGGLFVFGAVSLAMMLTTIESVLDIPGKLCSQLVGHLLPDLHVGWRVGDDEFAKAPGLPLDGILGRQHASPALSQEIKLFDAQMGLDIVQLSHEQIRCPEVDVLLVILEACALAASNLVVHDHGDAVVGVYQRDGEEVVVGNAGAAVQTYEGGLIRR